MADYEAIQRRNNFIVGAFVVIGITAFLWLVFVFGDMPMSLTRINSYPVFVHFPSAPGVQKSTPVQYCGYPIGKVATIAPPKMRTTPDGKSFDHITLELLIEKKFKAIPDYVQFRLVKKGFGSSYIELKANPDDIKAGVDYGVIVEGGEYWGKVEAGQDFFPQDVKDKLTTLTDKIGQMADNANAILGDKANQQNIKDVLENLSVATEQANETLKSISDFSEHGKASLASADKNFEKMTVSVADVAEQLNGALADMRVTLDKINNGNGTAGRFLNDGQLYENLLDSSVELQQALQQLKILAADARQNGLRIKW